MRRDARVGVITAAVCLCTSIITAAPAAAAGPSAITVRTPVVDQVVQRDMATGTGDVTVSGQVDVAGPVEASLDGQNWTPLAVTGTTFAGVLQNQPVGRSTLVVRSTASPSVSASVAGVGVGDVFAVMGDSNAVGASLTMQSYTGPAGQVTMFTQARVWRRLTGDPVDRADEDQPLQNCRWFLFVCLHHALYDTMSGGSVWPGVANRLAAASPGLPIGLVVLAKSGSGLGCDPNKVSQTCWQKPTGSWASDTYQSLYADALGRLRAMAPSGGVRAVIWFEGINDSGAAVSPTGRADYLAKLNRFVGNLVADYGPLDVVVSSPGDCDPDLMSTCANRDAGLDNVRGGVADAWASAPHVVEGPILYDIDKSTGANPDGIHYRDPTSVDTAAGRIAASVVAEYYGGPSDVGPRLVDAEGDDAAVRLTFDHAALVPGSPVAGVTVTRDSVAVPSQSAVAASENEVEVSLTGTGGTLEASVAPGRSGRSGDLVRDADGRPAVPAYSVPVTRTDPDVTEPTGTVTIAGGAVQTTATSVTLTMSAHDDRAPAASLDMQVSGDAGFAGATWQPFMTSLPWPLPAGTGNRTVYARFRDPAGNVSTTVSDSITVVAVPTTGPVRYVGGKLTLVGGGAFAAGIRPADFFGLRGNIYIDGTTYIQRNDVSRCGPACVQGSAFAFMRPNQVWKADLDAATLTLNGVTTPIASGTLNVT